MPLMPLAAVPLLPALVTLLALPRRCARISGERRTGSSADAAVALVDSPPGRPSPPPGAALSPPGASSTRCALRCSCGRGRTSLVRSVIATAVTAAAGITLSGDASALTLFAVVLALADRETASKSDCAALPPPPPRASPTAAEISGRFTALQLATGRGRSVNAMLAIVPELPASGRRIGELLLLLDADCATDDTAFDAAEQLALSASPSPPSSSSWSLLSASLSTLLSRLLERLGSSDSSSSSSL